MRKNIIEKFTEFYGGNKSVVFYDQEIEHRDRMLMVLELKMKELYITDLDVYEKVREKYDISYPIVLKDITVIERMIANELNPSGDPMKTFVRYFISEVAKKGIKQAIEKKDPKAISMLLNVIGKHHLTDKEDIVKPEWEKIIPFTPELTSDPSVIGIEKPENFDEMREKYRQKYESDYKNFLRKISVSDADIIEEDKENGD